MQYIRGVGTTLLVTAMALALGIVLGSLVALVRVAHDQQRPGRKNLSWVCSTPSAKCIPPSSGAPP